MIAVETAELVLRHLFLSEKSPFADGGSWFSVALHSEQSLITPDSELTGGGYQRAYYGGGEAWWRLSARSIVNSQEIRFPEAVVGQAWQPVRALALWSSIGDRPVWSVRFDSGSVTVNGGDQLVIPAGGVVLGFG